MARSEITITARAGHRYVPSIRRLLRRIETKTRVPGVISFVLVGDRTMARLHQQFLNIAGPTDVLTFELDHDGNGNVSNGEIIVCVPEAGRQSKKHGTKVAHELLLYCLHGILHLTGYDDLDEASHRKMHAAEDRILTAIGIGPVFRPSLPAMKTPAPKSKRRSTR